MIGTGKSALILDPRKISELKKNNYEVFSLGGFLSTNLSNEIQIDYYLLSDDRTIFRYLEYFSLAVSNVNTVSARIDNCES